MWDMLRQDDERRSNGALPGTARSTRCSSRDATSSSTRGLPQHARRRPRRRGRRLPRRVLPILSEQGRARARPRRASDAGRRDAADGDPRRLRARRARPAGVRFGGGSAATTPRTPKRRRCSASGSTPRSQDPRIRAEYAPLLDWGRRRMARYLDRAASATPTWTRSSWWRCSVCSGRGTVPPAEVEAAAHIIERGLLGRCIRDWSTMNNSEFDAIDFFRDPGAVPGPVPVLRVPPGARPGVA